MTISCSSIADGAELVCASAAVDVDATVLACRFDDDLANIRHAAQLVEACSTERFSVHADRLVAARNIVIECQLYDRSELVREA